MSNAGRPNKPISHLKLYGTYREDRHGHVDDQVDATGEPVRPEWLGHEAKQLWDRVVPLLIASGIAAEIDESELAAMCDWWGRYRDATRALDTIAIQERGYYSMQILAGAAWKNFSSIASRFGLTPSDRAKLRTGKTDDAKDALADFISSKSSG
jgi:P27 family predicted phage terminase small subunit